MDNHVGIPLLGVSDFLSLLANFISQHGRGDCWRHDLLHANYSNCLQIREEASAIMAVLSERARSAPYRIKPVPHAHLR